MSAGYPRPSTVAAALVAAAFYIERYGWTGQHPLYDDHDRCTRNCECHRTGRYPASILGAVRAALVGQAKWYMESTRPGTVEAYTACLDHLDHHLTEFGSAGLHAAAMAWQDAPGRTAAQVAAALRAAASTAPPVRLDLAPTVAPVVPLVARRAAAVAPELFTMPTRPAA
jgi:hypothetical protein